MVAQPSNELSSCSAAHHLKASANSTFSTPFLFKQSSGLALPTCGNRVEKTNTLRAGLMADYKSSDDGCVEA
jgi:hypothetical protein